jgi:hypothetical protein
MLRRNAAPPSDVSPEESGESNLVDVSGRPDELHLASPKSHFAAESSWGANRETMKQKSARVLINRKLLSLSVLEAIAILVAPVWARAAAQNVPASPVSVQQTFRVSSPMPTSGTTRSPSNFHPLASPTFSRCRTVSFSIRFDMAIRSKSRSRRSMGPERSPD